MMRESRSQVMTARDMAIVRPYIDGRFLQSESRNFITTYNPANGQALSEIPSGCLEDANRAVLSAKKTVLAGTWHGAPPSVRKATLMRWAELVQSNAERLDALDALEMGKPLSLSVFNAKATAGLIRFNAEAIDKYKGDVLTSDSSSTVIQKRTPRGIVAAIVPWNFPTYNVAIKVAPALATGNSVVLKPSELASQSPLLLAELAVEAGLPPGVLNVVPGCGQTVGRALGEHGDVNMIAFTGSSAVGKLMMQYASNSNMKVVSAECGGKSPHIVFDDGIDIDMVATSIARMIAMNQGQVCSVGSRLLVQATIEETLVSKIVCHLRNIVAGDPQQLTTDYGPLASKEQLHRVLSCIQTATADGADLVHGGSRLLETTGGYFVEPAVLINVSAKSRIAHEEVFGPVLSVLRFEDAADAALLANATNYGLAAYIWTSRIDTGCKLANALRTGVTMVNAAPRTGEGPGFAFSGEPFGLSGIGTEGGMAGLETYMRRQTIWFNHG